MGRRSGMCFMTSLSNRAASAPGIISMAEVGDVVHFGGGRERERGRETCRLRSHAHAVPRPHTSLTHPVATRTRRSAARTQADADGNTYVRGALEVAVSTPQELLDLLALGMRARATSATGVHNQSSRSHALCYIRVREGTAGACVREHTLSTLSTLSTHHWHTTHTRQTLLAHNTKYTRTLSTHTLSFACTHPCMTRLSD